MFKVGDRVRLVVVPSSDDHSIGDIGTISRDDKSSRPYKVIMDGSDEHWATAEELELISSTNQTTNQSTMNIQDKFLLAFKAEPEKSFRKAGITNGDDFLTDDGQKIFLSWLLKKNGNDFKKEVVDALLEEEAA